MDSEPVGPSEDRADGAPDRAAGDGPARAGTFATMGSLVLITIVVTALAMTVPAMVVWGLLSGVPASRISPPNLLLSDVVVGLLPPIALVISLAVARQWQWRPSARTALVCVSVIAADLAVLCYDLLTMLTGQS